MAEFAPLPMVVGPQIFAGQFPVRRRFLRAYRTRYTVDELNAAWYRHWWPPRARVDCELPRFRELPRHLDALVREFYRVFCEGVARFVLPAYQEFFLTDNTMRLTFGQWGGRAAYFSLHKDGTVDAQDSEGMPYPFADPSELSIGIAYDYPSGMIPTDWPQLVFSSFDAPFGGEEFMDQWIAYLEREGPRRTRRPCRVTVIDNPEGEMTLSFRADLERRS